MTVNNLERVEKAMELLKQGQDSLDAHIYHLFSGTALSDLLGIEMESA